MVNEFNYSSRLACISLVIFLCFIFRYRKGYKNSVCSKNVSYWGVVFFLILFSVFAFAEADTYHYMELYEDLYKSQFPWHVEPTHFWIIKHLPHGYYIWRLFVWGISAILYVKAFRHLNISACVAAFSIAIVALIPFPQTRGTLGFAIMMLALAYYKPLKYRNITWDLIVLALIVLSTFFHKTLGVYILLYPLALLVPYNKKTIALSLVLFPFLYLAVYTMANDILSLGFLGEQTVDRGESYLDRGSEGNYNIIGILTNSILWIALILYFYTTSDFYIKNVKQKTALVIHKYAYILVYVSFLFYGQNISNFLFTRTLKFALLPLAIAYAYYLQSTRRSKVDKATLFFFFLYTSYEITYHIYKFN